jgi:hypothetical protein
MLDEFLDWLKEHYPELPRMTLATGRWAEQVFKHGWLDAKNLEARSKHKQVFAPRIKEFLNGR